MSLIKTLFRRRTFLLSTRFSVSPRCQASTLSPRPRLCQGSPGPIARSQGPPLHPVLTRTFFGWLNSIFNKYDPDRVAIVGPDRACAEWLLRCGAAVRWKNSKTFLRDYNSLPASVSREQKIIEVDATDSAVMEVGFLYLKGLTHLKRIKFKNCKYLQDESMAFLSMNAGDKLEVLDVSFNGSITDAGIRRLANFPQLRVLHLEALRGVENPEKVLSFLQERLPSCAITYPPYTEEEK